MDWQRDDRLGGVACDSNCWVNTGGRYNPSTDSWTATGITDAPDARWSHKAFWTGREMIVWGGTDQTNYLRTGGRYNPATDTWMPTAIPTTVPGRTAFAAVWSGTEIIVWGGAEDGTFTATATGGRYNPVTDSWLVTSLGSAPLARAGHTGVWTGREMIVWGGGNTAGDFRDGARYNPGADAWTPMTTTNGPVARSGHTAVWTGTEMIVWGGLSSAMGIFLNDGGRYCAQPSTPLVQSAISRKSHGNAGNFDLDLPLSGTAAVESRSGGATGDYTIVVTFRANVSISGTPQATVTSGSGAIGSGGVSNGGAVTTAQNVVTIPLTNVANAQTIEVTLNNVNGSTNVTIPMRVLIGDVNGNGSVNTTDIGMVKASAGQPVGPTNFRADVSPSGSINATDVSLVKSLAGSGQR